MRPMWQDSDPHYGIGDAFVALIIVGILVWVFV